MPMPLPDVPYTTPEEDPFNTQPLHCEPRPRRSSLLDKWISEQQIRPKKYPPLVSRASKSCFDISSTPPGKIPTTDPLLNETPKHHGSQLPRSDVESVISYDLVDDQDLPKHELNAQPTPSTLTPSRARRYYQNIISPSSFRNFNMSFRSNFISPLSEASPADVPVVSRRISRISLSAFVRHSHQTPSVSEGLQTHGRSFSTSTAASEPRIHPMQPSPVIRKWRPCVLGYFSDPPTSTPTTSSEAQSMSSRPSVSSVDTQSVITPASSPTKLSFVESIRSRNRSSGSVFRDMPSSVSSSTVWSQQPPLQDHISGYDSRPSHASSSLTFLSRVHPASKCAAHRQNVFDALDDEDEYVEQHLKAHGCKYETLRTTKTLKRRSLARVSFSSLSARGQQKKKKLVISGVGYHEHRKFEGVKAWCESFGEVRQILRAPNGDLHIDFRRADVADTVCRLRAKVFISGVGSVQLSWFSGEKR